MVAQVYSRIHPAIAGPMRALAAAALATIQAIIDSPVFTEAFAAGQQMVLEATFATMLTTRPIAAMPTKP